MRAGRIVVVVVGAVLAVAGFGAVVGGGALAVVHAVARDDTGFYQTPSERLDTSTAVLVARLDLGSDEDGWMLERPAGTLRVRATAVDNSAVFLGIAPAADVDRWLAGTSYTRVDGVGFGPTRTELVTGGAAAGAPSTQTFWTASVAGRGTQALVWPSARGQWAIVLMNADARPGVVAEVSAGVQTGLILPLGLGLVGLGVLLLGGGIGMMLGGLAGTVPAGATAGTTGVPGSYPARLDGRLEPLSRWLWLVKWLLAIPHAIVLAFLWLALISLTVVAGFAILFTGRYPRAIFDFNVGVLRWTWRVWYYAFDVLGTDRYPPFNLSSDPDYPADFTVDYPARLSRGLVLVKWWLLAIPHYVVVAFFAGGWTVGFDEFRDNARIVVGGGLIGILVLVGMVVLLFTGRYPQPVYDFVMGMNRWCYRVLAYVALMRDEYPPFRLDNGGPDPGSLAPAQPPQPDRGGDLVGTTAR
jgi:hypothetical protein